MLHVTCHMSLAQTVKDLPLTPPLSTLHWFQIKKIITDILKVDFFLRGHNFSFEILRKKTCKKHTKNHMICVNHEAKTVKEI